MKTLYLSGAISHNPNYKQDFETAYKALTDAGYDVISPLYICHDDWDWNKCMRHCIEVLVSDCDAVAVILSGYISEGLKLETDIAQRLNMPVKTVEDWISHKGDK